MHIKINEIVSCVPLCEHITRLNRKMIDWLERRKKNPIWKFIFATLIGTGQRYGAFFSWFVVHAGKKSLACEQMNIKITKFKVFPLGFGFFSFFLWFACFLFDTPSKVMGKSQENRTNAHSIRCNSRHTIFNLRPSISVLMPSAKPLWWHSINTYMIYLRSFVDHVGI